MHSANTYGARTQAPITVGEFWTAIAVGSAGLGLVLGLLAETWSVAWLFSLGAVITGVVAYRTVADPRLTRQAVPVLAVALGDIGLFAALAASGLF